MIICKNCRHEYELKYCNTCGQAASMNGRLEAPDLAKDIFHSIFHTGSGFTFTISRLFTEPEVVLRGYIGGQRKIYFSPIKLFLVCSVVFLTVKHYVDLRHPVVNVESFTYFVEHYKYLFIFSGVFLTALLNYAFFRSYRLSFTEHFVAAMFIRSMLYLIETMFILLNQVVALPMIIVGLVACIFYYVWAFTRYYSEGNSYKMAIANLGIYTIAQLLFVAPFVLLNFNPTK
ncbi:MAG TPA: DUF3667 domain-containing protein [Flavobacterium sp.]|jgi:hypothetical protein